jgi:uncharacterized protein
MPTHPLDDCLKDWENRFIHHLSSSNLTDASHDLGHFQRVYHTAKHIAQSESCNVDPLIILAAAYFHDIISLPKNHPDNSMSSRLAAMEAQSILQKMGFTPEKIDSVCHAIAAHSFSAQLIPETIEAKVIQDADRMEALGALGAMRTFYVSGRLNRFLFDPHDFYANRRPLDDKMFAVDHFYIKLFKLPDLLQTTGGRLLANQRVTFLKLFISELETNSKQGEGGALLIAELCYQAGHQGLPLFDLIDPLALNRPLDHQFVIDQLVDSKLPFVSKFLSQFKEEISPIPSNTLV